jgi:hypothetical protein
MFKKSKNVINSLIEVQVIENSDIWTGSQFESLNDLKIDYSGKVGENVFFPFLIENTNWNILFMGDSNTNPIDGTYDGLVNGKRIEVKTARLGKSSTRDIYGGNFQHENLKNNNECDFVVFLDYTPSYILLTIKDFRGLDLDKPISEFGGITAHKRKGTHNIYKLDLKETTSIKKAQDNGLGIKIDNDTKIDTIIEFLSKFIGEESN